MIIHEEPSPNSVSSPVSTAKDSRCYTVEDLMEMPTEQSTINGALKQLIEENDLPKVVSTASDTPALHTSSS